MIAKWLTPMQFSNTEFQAPYFNTGDYNNMRKLAVLVDFDWPD